MINVLKIREGDDVKLARTTPDWAWTLRAKDADGEASMVRIDDATMESIVADYNAITQDEHREPKPMIGSVSVGTLRTQDLLPAFDRELRGFDASKATMLFDFYGGPGNGDFLPDDDPWWTGDAPADWLEDVVLALESIAPEGMTFGALEGDGADFGWWPITQEGRR